MAASQRDEDLMSHLAAQTCKLVSAAREERGQCEVAFSQALSVWAGRRALELCGRGGTHESACVWCVCWGSV
jgi:hypothetical protein